MNRFKSEKERKQIEKLLLKQMTSLLDEKDYNPRTKQFMFLDDKLNPNISMLNVLDLVLRKKNYTPEHRKIVESCLKKFRSIALLINLNSDILK